MINSMEMTKHVKVLLAIMVVVLLFGAGVIGWLTWDNAQNDQNTVSVGKSDVTRVRKGSLSAADPNDPSAAGTPVAKSVTQDEVMQHKSPTDCQTIIRGGVYDATSFIAQHPDGKMNVENTCGMDSTKLFEGQYGGVPKEEEQLKSLFVGVYMKK